MDLTIYTYGHIDAMFYILNGVAMLNKSALGQTVIALMVFASTVYYATRISYDGTVRSKIYLGKIVGMVAMVIFLLSPVADMTIRDHVSKKREKVDNLPLGFALPIGVLESFGDLLTIGFEQAFSSPNQSTNFHDYGMLFGARLVQESRNWKISSPEFRENMDKYINRCVMFDSMVGHWYTPSDLVQSDDIWRLVSENAAVIRMVSMRVGKERTLLSCKDAAKNVLQPEFTSEIGKLEARYAGTSFGEAGSTNWGARAFNLITSNLRKNIALSFKSYIGSNDGAEKLIRQQMMINAIKKNVQTDEYGFARASATQESNWHIAGELASTYLPILLTVFKGLVYSSFIFLMPLLLMSGGWMRYLNWITLIASLQLWAPLNSVLNLFIDTYTSSTLFGIANHIVSFSTMSKIGSYTDKIVVVASGLQMAIPFLAFSIIQGGVSGFIHLAGNITGASQGAASQAANEVVTGNKGFDNYSVGNQQLYNRSGFKTDWNESYAAGASSTQLQDGSLEKVTAGGNVLIQSGVGFTASGGSTAYKQEDSRHGQVNEGVQQQEALHQQDMRSASNAKSNTMSKTADYISHLAQREHAGESFNYDSMGEQGEAMKEAVNHTKQLHEKNGYGWQQAASASIEASIGLNGSTPKKGLISNVLGLDAGVEISGRVSNQNTSEQGLDDNTQIQREHGAEQHSNNLIKAASNEVWAKEHSIDTGYSDSVRESYEEQQRLEQQASISKQRVDDWHQARSIVESQGASSSKDMYQEVVDGIKQQGIDGRTAHKMADQRTPTAQKVWQKLQNEDHYVQNLVSTISSQRAQTSGVEADKQLDLFTKQHDQQVNQDNVGQKVKEHAANQGLDVNNFADNIKEKKDVLEQKHQDMTTENAAKYEEVKNTNEKEASRLQDLAGKYEEDRIGQGKVAKEATRFLNKLGVTGNIIGGPDKTISPYDPRAQAEVTPVEQEGRQTAINTLQGDPRNVPGTTEIPVEALTSKNQAPDIINEAVKVDAAPVEQVEQQKANNNLIKEK
jgi:hypothetical protein